MEDGLLGWIERECGLRELAKALHPLVHRLQEVFLASVPLQRKPEAFRRLFVEHEPGVGHTLIMPDFRKKLFLCAAEEQGQTEVLRGQQAPDPGPERELPYGIDRK